MTPPLVPPVAPPVVVPDDHPAAASLIAAAEAEPDLDAALRLYAQAADAGAQSRAFWTGFALKAVAAQSLNAHYVVDHALTLWPTDPVLLTARGAAAYDMRAFEQADYFYRASQRYAPRPQPEVWWTLGLIAVERERYGEAVAAFEQAKAAGWRDNPEDWLSHALAAGFMGGATPAQTQAWAIAWGRSVVTRTAASLPPPPRPGLAARPLRVGLFITNPGVEFVQRQNLPVTRGLIEAGAEVNCYGAGVVDPSAAYRAQGAAFYDLSDRSDPEIAAAIRRDGVDLLLTLDFIPMLGHGALFALRPAPLRMQLSHALLSLGGGLVDALALDAAMFPPGCDDAYAEALVRLPSYQAYLPDALALRPPARPTAPCAEGAPPCFGSFNRANKIDRETGRFWAAALAAAPKARLFLSNRDFSEPALRAAATETLAAVGIAPERLLFRGAVASEAEFLAGYDQVDLALDCLGFSGGYTTLDALWQGVPTVTVPAAHPWGRTTAAMMTSLGLEDLCVAATPEEAGRKAAALVADPAGLSALRADLRGRALRSPLMSPVTLGRAVVDWARDWLSQHYPEAAA